MLESGLQYCRAQLTITIIHDICQFNVSEAELLRFANPLLILWVICCDCGLTISTECLQIDKIHYHNAMAFVVFV